MAHFPEGTSHKTPAQRRHVQRLHSAQWPVALAFPMAFCPGFEAPRKLRLSKLEIFQSLRMCQRYRICMCHMYPASLQVGTSDRQWRLWYTRRNQEIPAMAAAGQLEPAKLTLSGIWEAEIKTAGPTHKSTVVHRVGAHATAHVISLTHCQARQQCRITACPDSCPN